MLNLFSFFMTMARFLLLLLPSMASAFDVVVVGAGVSGLTAARTLMDNWAGTGRTDPLNIFVLEGSARLGGRTFTNRNIPGWGTITGAEADMGASWIHGSNQTNHPVTQMANLLGLATLNTLNNAMKTTRCNADASQCSFDVADNFTTYTTYIKAAQAFASDKSQNSDMSMWDAMGNVSVVTRDDPAVQSAIGNTLEFEYGASPDTMSAWYYNDDKKMKGGGPEQLIVKGYSQIAEALQAGTLTMDAPCKPNENPSFKLVTSNGQAIDVRYNKQVTDISLDSGTNRLVVTTTDASSYVADRVIVTVPLGVLKRKAINFSPPLPAQKQTAISKLWFGDLIKVGMLFDTAWWNDASTHYFALAQDNVGGIPGLRAAEKFTYFLNTQAAGSGRAVLFTFVFGSSAMEVESWTDDKVWAAIYKNLVAVFKGADGVTVPTTKPAMWRSNWGTNPLFGGVYASNTVGVTKDDWKNLKTPVPVGAGAISFAGEHTNHFFRGTVHGAFWSGQRAACEALWPNGKSSVSSVATFNTANPVAAMANPGFAAGVDSGAAAAAGVPASAVTVSFSLTPPVTSTASSRRLLGNATNRTLYAVIVYAVQPGQAASIKAVVGNLTKDKLLALIKQALNSTNSTDDDVDFDIDDMDDPTEKEDIEDSEDDSATTGTTTRKPTNTTPSQPPSGKVSSQAGYKHLDVITCLSLALLAFVSHA